MFVLHNPTANFYPLSTALQISYQRQNRGLKLSRVKGRGIKVRFTFLQCSMYTRFACALSRKNAANSVKNTTIFWVNCFIIMF